jgi:ADP-ribose pyrophosphatase
MWVASGVAGGPEGYPYYCARMAAPSNRTVLRREVLHKGPKFDFERLTLSAPGGREVQREVIRHPGAAVIVPLLPGANVVLIRNDRFAVGKTLYELPAGTLSPGEPPDACAARELEEETGYRAATLAPLGRFYTTPGMTDELMWAFLATGLRHVGQRLEEDEALTVEVVGMDRALQMIDSGELMDAKSMLALLVAHRRGLLERV